MVVTIWTIYCLSGTGIFAPCITIQAPSLQECYRQLTQLTQSGSVSFGPLTRPMCYPAPPAVLLSR